MPGGMPFVYSSQRLNYTEMQKERMRQRLAKDKRSTYTYSADFQSLTVSLVNESEIEQQAAAAARSKWTTKRGFVYPAPKDPEEFRRHPKALSDARKEDLRQPWDDPHDRPAAHLLDKDKSKRFDTVPAASSEFGYVDAKGRRNPDFFKSVHLTGDGLAKEEAAAKKRQEEEWMKKVVVDDLRFQPHYPPKTTTQLNKLEGLLKGPVKDKSLRIVHRAKLPSGKRTAAPTAAPISILTSEPFVPASDFTANLKPNDPKHFVGDGGFVTTVNPNRMKPASHTVKSKGPKAAPMASHEMTGPKWGK